MLKTIFKLFKKDFIAYAFQDDESKAQMIEYVFKNQRKSGDKFAGWQVSFIDSNGVKYYSPDTDLDLPINRLAVFSRYMDFLNTCISPKEFETLLSDINTSIDAVINSGKFKGIAKIKVLTEEAKEYLSHPVHADMYFLIASTFYVREDEDPAEYDLQIEVEKVEQLKKDSKDGLYDFFYRTPLRGHLEQFGITEDTLTEYLNSSIQRGMEMKKIMELLSETSGNGQTSNLKPVEQAT